jgi:hypothetical protein
MPSLEARISTSEGWEGLTVAYSELEVVRSGGYYSDFLCGGGVMERLSAGTSKRHASNEHVMNYGSMATRMG